MRRALLLAFLLPLAAHAQLAVFSVNGSTETPLGGIFNFGNVAQGATQDVRFRARNTGASAIQITTLSLSGAGFTIVNTPSIPFTIAPGNFQDVTVHFVAGIIATYSANFQLNSVNALVLATVVPAATVVSATLASGSGCTGPDPSSGNISFGSIASSATATCAFTLSNQNSQPVTVNTLTTSGAGFGNPQGAPTPLTLLAGGTATFTINFTPTTPAIYSGTLTIDSRSFTLSGTAVAPAIPTPLIGYDTGPLQSAQQRNLTLSLPSPAPLAFSGYVTLAFTPDTSLVTDDPSVVFAATGARSLPFTIHQGDTQMLVNGQASAVFQTGTTSGKIRLSLTSNLAFAGDPTAILTIPPAKVFADNAFGSALPGSVVIQVTGFDNTYSAGPMSFIFYDTSGNQLKGGILNADFTSSFRSYFLQGQAGGMFQAGVTFPVSGDVNLIGAVDVALTNSAGTTTLPRITFPPCQLNGLACVPN
jgi:hypothetical protein